MIHLFSPPGCTGHSLKAWATLLENVVIYSARVSYFSQKWFLCRLMWAVLWSPPLSSLRHTFRVLSACRKQINTFFLPSTSFLLSLIAVINIPLRLIVCLPLRTEGWEFMSQHCVCEVASLLPRSLQGLRAISVFLRVIERFRLEKVVIKSPTMNITLLSPPLHLVLKCHVYTPFKHLPGMVTQTLPWPTCSNASQPFQWKNFP